MAAKHFNLFRGGGRNALDLPVAGLSGLAAAFAAFAIPQDILSRAVMATGLPGILSAAQPPLGLTARLALAIGGAAIVFGLVFLTLRLLDRSGLGGTETSDEGQLGPRVRRRDLHPDAPAPRPISAARDLGEPAPPQAPRDVPLWLDEAEPAPSFAAAPAPAAEPEFEPEPEAGPAPWRAPEPVVFPEPSSWSATEPQPALEPALDIEPEAEVLPAPEPEPAPVETEAVAVAPAPIPAPAAEMPTSIAELIERLEQGLARRKRLGSEPLPAPVGERGPDSYAAAEAPQAFREPQAPVPPDAADDRLQSAIASLQRLAARSA